MSEESKPKRKLRRHKRKSPKKIVETLRGKDPLVVVFDQEELMRMSNEIIGGLGDFQCKDLTIWGGNCMNMAETALSRWAQSNRDTLCRFLYLPQSHKGGRMVRPRYARGSREDRMEFPSLRDFGYWADIGRPFRTQWDCPHLTSLFGFIADDIEANEDTIKMWSSSEFLAEVMEDCPRIAKVTLARCLSLTSVEWSPVIEFESRDNIEWPLLKMIELVRRKEKRETCQFAKLPSEVLNLVCEFLAQRRLVRV